MSNKIRTSTNPRQVIRFNKKIRIRKKIVRQKGKICRLVVYRSNKFLYAQVVDDLKGVTLAQANTQEETFKGDGSRKSLDCAKTLGKMVAERALLQKVDRVVFDRNGYVYHGRIKALAESAREAGLKF